MATRSTEIEKLVKKVRKTPDWKVVETDQGAQIYSPDSDKPVAGYHRSGGSHHNVLLRLKDNLKRAGWSEALYEEARETERQQRLTKAMAASGDTGDYRISPAVFSDATEPPPPPKLWGSMHPEFVAVSPQMASEWLERDRQRRTELDLPLQNRNLREDYVASWARDMVSGRWMVTHEAIAFDTNDCIVDGQHRLKCVVESGATVTMLVVTGCAPETILVVDTGIRRTAGDVLNIRRIPNANQVAAAIRLLALYDNVPLQAWRRTRIGNHLVMEMYDAHPQIVHCSRRAARLTVKAGLLRSSATVGIYLAQRAWPTKEGHYRLGEFVLGTSSGENLTSGDPRLRLRNFGINSKLSHRRRMAEEHLALFLKCWNAYASGRTLGHLAWRGGKTSPEPMPVPYRPEA